MKEKRKNVNTCLINFIVWIHLGGPGSWLERDPVECLDLFAARWLVKDNKLLEMTNSLCVAVTPKSMASKLKLKISCVWIDAKGCKIIDVVGRKICLSYAK